MSEPPLPPSESPEPEPRREFRHTNAPGVTWGCLGVGGMFILTMMLVKGMESLPRDPETGAVWWEFVVLAAVLVAYLAVGLLATGFSVRRLLFWLGVAGGLVGLTVLFDDTGLLGGLLAVNLGLWVYAFELHHAADLKAYRRSDWAFLSAGIYTGLLLAIGIINAMPVVASAREAARRTQCRNNMHQLAIALANYEEAYGAYPPAVVTDAQGKPMYSWAVLLLPFIEEGPLYRKFDLTRAWDDPVNAEVVATHLGQFECPSASFEEGHTNGTHYRMIVCPGSIGGVGKSATLKDITDGTAQTLIIAECAEPVPWASPAAVVDLTRGLNRPGGAGSKHEGGLFVAFAGVSVTWLDEDMDHMALVGLCTMAGGEKIDEDDY